MPFVLELITEEDKRRFDFNMIKNPPTYMYPIRSPHSWTIDRDRDAFLLCISTGGRRAEYPGRYVLVWAGEVIHMELKESCCKHIGGGFVVTWRLRDLWMPARLHHKREEVIQLMKDALVAYGLFGAPAPNVNFEF